jgi:LysM repeat protein/uncharacterized protein YvpB
MRRFLFPLAFLVALLALTSFAPLTVRADDPSHMVSYGETLYSIAREYGVTPAALASANGITTDSWVYAGQYLTIPSGQSSSNSNSKVSAPVVSVAKLTNGGTYTVQAGDSLSSVSRKFGVSIYEIAEANNIPPNGYLYTGWELNIPGVSGAAAEPAVKVSAPEPASKPVTKPSKASESAEEQKSTIIYTVRAGDTLYGIAIKHGVTMAAITIASDLGTPFVYTGQKLTIPGAAASASTETKTQAPAAAAAVKPGLLAEVQGVPVYKQKQTLTCEQAAASMATRGALSEQEIVDAMPRSENPFDGIRGSTNYAIIGGLEHYGTYAQGLQKGLAKLGRHSTAYYGQPYDKFRESMVENLKKGRPVIWWTTWRESIQRPRWVELTGGIKIPLTPYEHAVVIVKATEEGITYHDPYDGTVRFTSWANHQRTSGYFNNMALVVF